MKVRDFILAMSLFAGLLAALMAGFLLFLRV